MMMDFNAPRELRLWAVDSIAFSREWSEKVSLQLSLFGEDPKKRIICDAFIYKNVISDDLEEEPQDSFQYYIIKSSYMDFRVTDQNMAKLDVVNENLLHQFQQKEAKASTSLNLESWLHYLYIMAILAPCSFLYPEVCTLAL